MFKAIVVGTDGSDTAQEAVRQAAELARLAGSTLHVVTAYGAATAVTALAGAAGYASEALALPQQRNDAETLLDRAVASVDTDGIEVEARARQGEAAEVLMAVARDVNADLIVVGSRGLTGARRFLLGSVPNRIAHHAECSVHIVHTCWPRSMAMKGDGLRHHYEDYLREVPVFSACSPKELTRIAGAIERVDVRAGDVLVREGANASEFFIILAGEAQVTRKGQFLAALGSGRHFGELALLDPAPRNATVTMTSDGQVLVLTQREFFTLLRDVPGLVKQLLTGLAQRVHTLDPTASRTPSTG